MRLTGPPQPPSAAPDVASLLARAATWPPDGRRTGVTFVDAREREVHLGWDEVHRRAQGAAAALRALGVRPGDRVALVLRTEPAFLDAFFGASLAGAVPVPLYPPVRLGRMPEYLAATSRMVAAAGARLLVAGEGVRRLLGEVVATARPPLGCVPASALVGDSPSAECVDGSSPSPRSAGRGPGRGAPDLDLALVQFSSGSTAAPKPVALTHAAVTAQVASLLAVLQPTPADLLVSWLPLYHDMGLIGGLLGALAYPGPLVLIPPEHFLARPALWLRALSRHRGTVSVAPSFAYAYAATRVRDEEPPGLRPLALAGRARRRRAGLGGGAAPLRRALRAVRPRPPRAHPGVRPVGGGAGGHLHAAGARLALPHPRSARAGGARRGGGGIARAGVGGRAGAGGGGGGARTRRARWPGRAGWGASSRAARRS